VLRENADGTWKLGGEYLGGSRLFIVDAKDQTRLLLWIKDAFPKRDFDKYVHQTTAGPQWEDYALHYFVTIHEKPHFCVRTWWGRRILLDLTAAKQVSDQEAKETLRSTEEATVMDRLRAGVTLMKGKKFKYLHEIYQTLAAVHWAGRMKMEKAVPLLQQLEESDYVGSCSFVPMFDLKLGEINPSSHCVFEIRRMVQLALRRMGVKPAGYPATTIRIESENTQAQKEAVPKNRHGSRVDNADRITKDMKPLDVLDKLGPPDYVERWNGDAVAWRYDMDAEPAFSLLVIIDQQKVESVEKWTPALWNGNDLVPASVEKHVFDADASISDVDAFRTHYGKVDPSEQPSPAGGRVPRYDWLYWVAGGSFACFCVVLAAMLVRRQRQLRASVRGVASGPAEPNAEADGGPGL
jgi:hypothetical protein